MILSDSSFFRRNPWRKYRIRPAEKGEQAAVNRKRVKPAAGFLFAAIHGEDYMREIMYFEAEVLEIDDEDRAREIFDKCLRGEIRVVHSECGGL
jgi:hypothetical protein